MLEVTQGLHFLLHILWFRFNIKGNKSNLIDWFCISSLILMRAESSVAHDPYIPWTLCVTAIYITFVINIWMFIKNSQWAN